MPSKVLTYFCAGRPILAAMPKENLAARAVERSGAGVVVSSVDVRGFLAAAERLVNGDGLRAAMGKRARSHAERTFAIEQIGDDFEDVLARIVQYGSDSARPVEKVGALSR